MIATINIGMDPNLVTIGSFTLTWHGLMSALAVAVGFLVIIRLAKGAGITASSATPIILWGIFGGIIFARLFHVLDEFALYSRNPADIFKIWEGGLAIYGAILGGAVTGVLYAKLRGSSMEFLGRLGDAAAPGLILGMAIGRVGCTINGDARGTPTGLPWGVAYTHPNHYLTTQTGGYVGHPAPVYEIIWDLLVLAVLWRLRGRLKPDGVLFLLYLCLYSVGRFFISYVRVNKEVLFGLQQAQVIALLVLIICVPSIIYLTRKRAES